MNGQTFPFREKRKTDGAIAVKAKNENWWSKNGEWLIRVFRKKDVTIYKLFCRGFNNNKKTTWIISLISSAKSSSIQHATVDC